MTEYAFVPREMIERKPRHGEPCNSCGVCCAMRRCQIGIRLFGEGGRCPALVKTGEHEWSCGIVREIEDEELRAAALLLIRAGEGCDARINEEWINTKFHKLQDRADRKNKRKIKRAKALWEIKP